MCQTYAFEGMFSGIVAISTVIVLCIERYTVGCAAKSKDQTCFYVWSVLFAVGNGLFWGVMPLLGWSRYAIEHTGTSCALDWKNPDEGYVSYLVTLEIFAFSVPMCVAAVCLYYAYCKAPVRPDPQASTSNSTKAASGSTENVEESDQASTGFTESQLRNLCCVFLVFVAVGWGPFAFLCTKTMLAGAADLSMLAGTIPPLACKLLVSAYPASYAVTSARFRQSFLAVIGVGEKKEE